ncbi:PucR family transcriptional regulator [Nocardioides sp. BGMRC 2183]|nr:PucR family transcriptional regulator [Nocardioides sp. BGMRC 2183]
MSSLADPMIAAIIRQVQAQVSVDERTSGPCSMVEVAARSAVGAFVNGELGRDSASRKADELFRRIGFQQAQRGDSVEPLLGAMRIAVRCVWDHLADFAVSQHYTASGMRDLTTSLLTFSDRLRDQLVNGHELGRQHATKGRAATRERLFDVLSRASDGNVSPLRPPGMDVAALGALAQNAGWQVPDRVVALSVTYHGPPPTLPEHDGILARVEDDRLVVLCPEEESEDLIADLLRSGDRRVAISWAVEPEESASALRWTARALDLVRLGVIAPTHQVRCTDHVTQLWLCAEPSMRERLCQELLEPLLAESPNSREILSDTLLAWLETRDSAPAIAARLGVHPQTVRYRWKRIHDMFGDALQDPEFVLLVTMVLKTTVLMWKAGHADDIERFKDGEPTDR